ncbi:hypothetical protein [Merismopedia glauca]|uniref:Late competence development ComFB family protein n=1 Tax=Merismopedia glauca CCAP 1448/3 TaxID=1296344 RepID=A0A2T1BXN0_9CYAN|nr:hypothetical protein [Merismopedia glauca]PSB00770.1 hypothetical protein C7B64_21815 [Merismopedia glauca CCAP 1448/3]
MSHELINLTLPIVTQEIEDVLEEYPEYPYQSAFLMPELRLQLIAHVLSQIPNRYEVKGIQKSSNNGQARHSSLLKERLGMEMLIRGGILHILRENADWLSHQLPKV